MRHLSEVKHKANSLPQAWANYGPGAICGPSSFLIRSAEFEEISKSYNICFSSKKNPSVLRDISLRS